MRIDVSVERSAEFGGNEEWIGREVLVWWCWGVRERGLWWTAVCVGVGGEYSVLYAKAGDMGLLGLY